MKTNLKKLQKCQLEIDFEITPEELDKHAERALLRLKNDIKIDGFRPGQAPLEMVKEKVGEEKLLTEAANSAVRESYIRFVNENNLEPVGQPDVEIVKISRGNPFLFRVKIEILPEVELPDYKKIAAQIKGLEVSAEYSETEDALRYLQKSRAKISQVAREAKDGDFIEIEYQNENLNGGKEIKDGFILGKGGFLKDFEENLIGMKSGEKKEFKAKFPDNMPDKSLAGQGSVFRVKIVSVQKIELPEINDDFAKSLGAFGDLDALKKGVKEGIFFEKQEEEKMRRRSEILSVISGKTKVELPEKMAYYEQTRMFEELRQRIESSGKITFAAYLDSIKKTEEEIKNSFAPDAQKRIKDFLIIRQIGRQENIEVSNEEIEEKINELIKNYSPEQLNKVDIGSLKEYTKNTIYNEKVFQTIEKL